MRRIKTNNCRFLKAGNNTVSHIQAGGSSFLPILSIKEGKTTFEVKTKEYTFVVKYDS